MKKSFIVFLLLGIISVTMLGMTGCDKTGSLSFNTLQVNETLAYGNVSNSTESFSFEDEIVLKGEAKYDVAVMGESGLETLTQKTVSLNVGDNVFYIVAESGESSTTYTVTIRRRPIYEVTFNTNTDEQIAVQYIEEDCLATKPADIQKAGYIFNGWDYDFIQSVTSNIVVSAQWEIEYYGINYVLYGGENNAQNPNEYTINDQVTLQAPTHTDIQYLFMGWYDNENFEGEPIDSIISSTGEKTLYARWASTILIVEKFSGDSTALYNTLLEGGYAVEVKNIDENDFPVTTNSLCNYSKIIMNNIANSDLPEDFDVALKSYVSDFGGKLLTVGGNDEDGNQHSYLREDMFNTTYEKLLPVDSINYTDPKAVCIIVDHSGSMLMTDPNYGRTYFQWAMAAVTGSLNAMSERDYIGAVVFEKTSYEMPVQMTSCKEQEKILSSLSWSNQAGDSYVGGIDVAITHACDRLRAVKQVKYRHIIVITDGAFSDDENSSIERVLNEYNSNYGITMSMMVMGAKDSQIANGKDYKLEDFANPQNDYEKCLRSVIISKGYLFCVSRDDIAYVVQRVREDIINFNIYTPSEYKPIKDGNALDFTLDGFYSAKLKEGANLILTADYGMPLYAEWNYGKGKVGSFMCDLKGDSNSWSKNIFETEKGKQLLYYIIQSL